MLNLSKFSVFFNVLFYCKENIIGNNIIRYLVEFFCILYFFILYMYFKYVILVII